MKITSQDIVELRKGLGWSQSELANYLRVRQPTVARMESGQEPSGPISKLLEELIATPKQTPAPAE